MRRWLVQTPLAPRYETAWLILQKLRRATVAPERSLLTGEVEIDEFWLGGYEEGLKGSCQHGKKALVDAAIEVRGADSGRLRLQALANSRAKTLLGLGAIHDPTTYDEITALRQAA